KPENIMLGRDDRGGTIVKVLDLGIAKMVGAGDVHAAQATSLTVAGQILGTPYYMSPEQWGEMPRDGNPEVDGRTDVYSLGVIFFELVAGRKPLGGRTLSELRQKHVAEPLPSLSRIVPGVPEGFSRGVARAMAKDRADRPRAAGEWIEELGAAPGVGPGAGRARGYVTDAGAINLTDAGRARGTSAQGQGAGGAATAHPSPETSAGQFDHSRAETILTSEMESPATTSGRETAAQPARPVTSGNVAARRGGRETFAARAAGTQAEAPADSWQEQASGEHRQAIPETRAAQATPETRAAFGDEGSNQGGRVVTAPVARRSLAPLVAAGVLALLVVAGVGGWLAWRSMQPKTGATVAQPTPAANATAPTKAAEATKVEKVEAASYWFETFDKPDDAAGKRVAETIPTLVSGQRFRFHFMPQERGYLYIIGPG